MTLLNLTPDAAPITWRLHAVMASRGMKYASDLKSALSAAGTELSISTVSRLVHKTPVQMDLALLGCLCSILNCTPNELLHPGALVHWVINESGISREMLN